MAKVEPGLQVSFCEEELLYLIVPCPSGVVYSAQTAGVMCEHPRVEGAVVAVAEVGGIGDVMCETGCWGRAPWTENDVASANAALIGVRWRGFAEIQGARLSTERLSESHEGWWWVELTLVAFDAPPRDLVGVICGPNCD